MYQTPIRLPSHNNNTAEDYLVLPMINTINEQLCLENYITSISCIRESTRIFLSKPIQTISLPSCKTIYVLQGELAHLHTHGILMSDQATTCHILAIHSYSRHSLTQDTLNWDKVMGSLCHLDAPYTYATSIEQTVYKHLQYHTDASNQQLISVTFHIIGGFLDSSDMSRVISNDLLATLINVTMEYNNTWMLQKMNHLIQWNLGTCAITSLNHTICPKKNVPSPIGRGLALDISSGQVYLAKMNPKSLWIDSIVPSYSLRCARLWSKDQSKSQGLTLIHTEDTLFISPFQFTPSKTTDFFLSLQNDHQRLLQYTSTSPECEEEEEYCTQVIQTLQYIHHVSCSSVFGNVGQEKNVEYEFLDGGWKRRW